MDKPSHEFCSRHRINRIRQMISVYHRKSIANQIGYETVSHYFAGINVGKWLALLWISENHLHVVNLGFRGEMIPEHSLPLQSSKQPQLTLALRPSARLVRLDCTRSEQFWCLDIHWRPD